jgi:hypothetical protein
MADVNINNPTDFRTYPNNRVCAIIETGDEARNIVTALLKNNIEENNIDIFYNSKGVEIFDAEAEHHGVIAKIVKKLRAYGDMENDLMQRYEKAMEKGEYIFEIKVGSDDEKEEVHQILLAGGARDINYFGSLVVESLKSES